MIVIHIDYQIYEILRNLRKITVIIYEITY